MPISRKPVKPSSMFSRLSLIASELIQVLERKPCIGVSIPLLDDLCIEKGSIPKEDIG